MDERIASLKNPRSRGQALQGPRLNAYWKYRVGDYRVVCQIVNERLVIIAVEVGHRREVYR